VLVGNAGVLGPLSPLDHAEPKDFETIMAVNVTANWQLIRTMDVLLKRADAGRAVFVSSGLSWMAKAYCGVYATSKAALNMMIQTYAAETATTKVRANLFNPGPTRTRMRASGWPGEDPETLPTPEEVAETLLPLCLPSCTESGKVYDFPAGKFLEFRTPA
jgi:NAD(P)-dependent dehydrogenase (short-subunit alcohol dehydrogenase family)